jgi:hypothetical protein
MKTFFSVLAVVSALVGCGESPQTSAASKNDTTPYTGVGKAFSDGSWEQRDKASWESHLKARAQYGQNDYTRMK